ncbi:arginine--tRNA ligase [Candidatus Peribacteria bacterium]|nr:arginine--tRNA ligase [Candidatus Peribacteria bacterium]
MYDLKDTLQGTAEAILKEKYGSSTTVHFQVSFEDGHGDLTTSVALQLAKKVGSSPREVAQVLVDGLKAVKGITDIAIAGPGFVNITLDPEALIRGITTARKACVPMKKRNAQPVIIDYSAPNIAKPLGIHHILSTIIGQSNANMYRHLGYETVSINHIGDWGTQFGKLAVAQKKWGKKDVGDQTIDELLGLYVRFHEELEKDKTLEDEGRLAFKKLEEGDKELRAFWKAVITITMKSMEKLYERLDVHFDFTQGESFYEDKMKSILEEGKEKGVFKKGEEGALIVEFSEESKLPPAIVMKKDGATNYLTRDLATARYRIDMWNPQEVLYVVDIAQQLYFKQLFATLGQLAWKLPHLEHIIFGRMSFADKGMSTRKGNILRLEEVLDEAVKRASAIIEERGEKIQTDDPKALAEMMGVGSVVYGVLSQNRKMDMVFDWDKMLSFEGNSAPYLQYTYARAKSVLRKAGSEGSDAVVTSLTEKERKLLKQVLLFSEMVEAARREHLPHTLAHYLYELCQAFNSFYACDEIATSSGSTRDFRLALTSLTAEVLKTGANILTLRVPERM